MRVFEVEIPIAGYASVTVEAGSEDEAIELAMGKVTIEDIQNWEPLKHFSKGNVCYCPQPWDASAFDCGPSEPMRFLAP